MQSREAQEPRPNTGTMMSEQLFEVRGEYIALDALLKATGLASSGGAAKAMVAAGLVQVDGQTELRKTCKIRAGQWVVLGDARIQVQAASAAAPAAS